MNLPRPRLKMTSIVIVIILVIGGIAGGAILLFQGFSESEDKNAEISGYIFDTQSGIGLIDEVCVRLEKENASFKWQRFWPNRTDDRGHYEFSGLGPGTYSLTLARSWARVTIGDPDDDEYLDGGWNLSGRYYIDVKPGEHVTQDIYLDFSAYSTWQRSIDNPGLRGFGGTIFGWGTSGEHDWLGNNSNLVGKNMTIEVVWENSAITRSDFTIYICDLTSTEDTHYEVGPQRESITWELTEEYFEYIITCQIRDWRIDVDSLPSPETSDILYTINWVIE